MSQSSGNPTKRRKLSDNHFSEQPASQCSDDEDGKKWQTLEHHAMTFPPCYSRLPSTVSLLNKAGTPVPLTEKYEEFATWWSETETTDFGQKQKVRENFWAQFKAGVPKVSSNFVLHTDIGWKSRRIGFLENPHIS